MQEQIEKLEAEVSKQKGLRLDEIDSHAKTRESAGELNAFAGAIVTELGLIIETEQGRTFNLNEVVEMVKSMATTLKVTPVGKTPIAEVNSFESIQGSIISAREK